MSDVGKTLFNKEIEQIAEDVGIQKYEAFSRWICSEVLGIKDEGVIDEATSIDGKGDHGVDIFYVQDKDSSDDEIVYIIQCKYSEKLDYRVTREEIESFAGTLSSLKRCPESANKVFRQKSVELEKVEKNNSNIRKRMIFAVTGKANSQVEEMLGGEWKKEKFENNSDVEFEILDLEKIIPYIIIPPTPEINIEFDSGTIEKEDKSTNKKSIIGYIQANSLIKLSQKYKDTIFLENPRESLGKSAPTHYAMIATLSDPRTRKQFWKLNNGVTAICDSFEGTKEHQYRMKNFRIVNGRQTAFTLESHGSIDGVSLLITVHEAVDDDERNQISEATNTQNPIQPADLVTNYFEMKELVLECKENYPEFYFERQTKGYKAAHKSVRNRVTSRRLMEKGVTARAYYAYSIDPNGASMPDKELFLTTNKPNYYERVFKDRTIKDLIIPHIFKKTLDELHGKWCIESKTSSDDKLVRDKEIISKKIVKYYILRFIHESMMSIDDQVRETIKNNMIEKFRVIKQKDDMPEEFLQIAQFAYAQFMRTFNMNRKESWPEELMKRIKQKGREDPEDIPTAYDIMNQLKLKGPSLITSIFSDRSYLIQENGDKVKESLLQFEKI